MFYWRSQNGVLELGGKWHGTALVLGRVGRNLVVAHRRSLLRCAPEQLRHASSEERAVAEFPESELLGIKNLLERGQFPKSQFTDIVGQGAPPQPEAPEQVIQSVQFCRMMHQQPVQQRKCFNSSKLSQQWSV